MPALLLVGQRVFVTVRIPIVSAIYRHERTFERSECARDQRGRNQGRRVKAKCFREQGAVCYLRVEIALQTLRSVRHLIPREQGTFRLYF
jgi:hypothetical protein